MASPLWNPSDFPNYNPIYYFTIYNNHSITSLRIDYNELSSHNGVRPPLTALLQSLRNIAPRSASHFSRGSLNDDISMVPDITQPDEPRCSNAPVPYNNDDCLPDIPCDDDQGPTESCEMKHVWDADNFDTVDAWAVVPSEGNETIEKYICSACFKSFVDQDSIIKHLWQKHEKKLQFLSMYLVEIENDSP